MMRKLLVASLSMVLVACGATSQVKVMPEDPYYTPILPEQPSEKLVENGSLFNATMVNSLYSDKKGHRVGDIITVTLRETTTASKSATTGTGKTTSLELEPVTAMGAANNVTVNGNPLSLGLDSSSTFNGNSTANQNNSLFGNISVNVMQVLANGNLVIRGEKWLRLNNGDEYIRLTGIVRPEDVSYENTIMSSKIANARIQYSGTGAFADTQYQGWLTQFFNGTWWPF